LPRSNAVLTMVGGGILYGPRDFASLSAPVPPGPPAASPPSRVPGPATRARPVGPRQVAGAGVRACASGGGIHGHAHGIAWEAPLPVADKTAFWGALGCSCFAV